MTRRLPPWPSCGEARLGPFLLSTGGQEGRFRRIRVRSRGGGGGFAYNAFLRPPVDGGRRNGGRFTEEAPPLCHAFAARLVASGGQCTVTLTVGEWALPSFTRRCCVPLLENLVVSE